MIDLFKGDTRLIIDACRKRDLLRNQVAYVLATVQWETAWTMQPINEAGGPAYFKRMYDKDGNRPHVARRLGNTVKGDGVRFHGRGYVQITGRSNYRRAGEEIGVDLVARPEDALQPEYAAPILVTGMVEGWFTGRKLSDYITLNRSDFKGARRIINGADRDDEIAAIAADFDKTLKAKGYGVSAKTLPRAQPPGKPPGAPPGVDQSFWHSYRQSFWTTIAAFIGRLFHRR
uniref:glycoside hydrolase family 19 protein n=1 Tax=Pararhizobium sp. IMCC3301 TaxID=3067904 RepID=UPI00274232E8|nr:glycoside hydrolase family 19 protein [Pararhizobium sp. IMCC3301]